MSKGRVDWRAWRDGFAVRSERTLPELEDSHDYSGVPPSVARSLATFQLGESGGGTVVEQARRSGLETADEHYAQALRLFVAEEHRHAEILAICVRNLGGSLIRRNWTAVLFVFFRRLLGLRLKVLVLLVAEVVGICYYRLIASRLPASRLRSLLEQIAADERSHLHFHCTFLRAETRSRWRRFVFTLVWRLAMRAAAIVTLVDHRAALRDLRLPARIVWRRWMSCARQAERLVVGRAGAPDAAASGSRVLSLTDQSLPSNPHVKHQPAESSWEPRAACPDPMSCGAGLSRRGTKRDLLFRLNAGSTLRALD